MYAPFSYFVSYDAIDQKGWKKTLKVANSIHNQTISAIKYSKYFMLRMIIIDVKFDGFTKATAKIIYCSRTHSQIAQVYSPTTKKDNWIGLKGIEEHSLSTSMCYCWKPYSILYQSNGKEFTLQSAHYGLQETMQRWSLSLP